MLWQWLPLRKGFSMGKEISWAVRPTVDMLQVHWGRIKARKHSDGSAGCSCSWCTCNRAKTETSATVEGGRRLKQMLRERAYWKILWKSKANNVCAKKENPDINIQKLVPFALLHLIFRPQQKQQSPLRDEWQKLALSHFRLAWIYCLINLASAL